MADRYTKVVLTVIAVALVWLCVWGQGPHSWGTRAEASGVSDAYNNAYNNAYNRARERRLDEADVLLRAAAQREREKEAQINAERNAAELARPNQSPAAGEQVIRVDIAAIGGRPIQVDWSTRFDGLSAVHGLPVQVKSAGY